MAEGLIERVRSVVSDQLGVDPAQMKSDANILEDLGADSLYAVQLVMAIEEVFDIEISDEEAEAMRTVGDVENYVSAHVAA